jgi:murein DD-endopeptidase MepM/ murein hydrolase activator NlpD
VRLAEEILPDESRDTLCQLQHMLEESPQQYYLQLETTEAQLMTPQEVEDLLWVSQPGVTDAYNECEDGAIGHHQELASGEAALLNPTASAIVPAAEDVSARAFLPLVLVQRQVRRRWLHCAMVLERPLVEVTNELALNRLVWPERLKQHSLSVVLGVSIAGLWAAGAVQSLLGGTFHPLRDKMTYGMTTYAATSRILTQEAQQLLPAKAITEAAEIPESLHVVDEAFLKDKLLKRLDEETFEKLRAQETEKALEKLRQATEAKRRRLLAHLTLPLRGLITSRFGHRWGRLHRGLDISAPVGSAIHAAQEGVVESVHFEQGYGLTITMRHPSGLKTRYAHCQRAFVRAGQRVTLGTRIAAIGMTGNTTGPHLHFEVVKNGVIQNPDKFLNG